MLGYGALGELPLATLPTAGSTDTPLSVTAASLSLSGKVVNGIATEFANHAEPSLSAKTATLAVIESVTSASPTIAGQSVTLSAAQNYTLTVTSASPSLSGGSATLRTTEVISASTPTISGKDVTLTAVTSSSYTLTVDSTALSLNGQAVDLIAYVPRETPAGRKRRRKYIVEIDGQEFVTESLDQARSILEQAAEIAVPKAQESAREIVQKAIQRAKRVGGIQKPKIQAPPELKAEVKAVRKVYDDALRDAEIQLLLLKQAEQDDEEALLLLI